MDNIELPVDDSESTGNLLGLHGAEDFAELPTLIAYLTKNFAADFDEMSNSALADFRRSSSEVGGVDTSICDAQRACELLHGIFEQLLDTPFSSLPTPTNQETPTNFVVPFVLYIAGCVHATGSLCTEQADFRASAIDVMHRQVEQRALTWLAAGKHATRSPTPKVL